MARRKIEESSIVQTDIASIYEENKHDIHAVFDAARKAGIESKEVYAHIIELNKSEKE